MIKTKIILATFIIVFLMPAMFLSTVMADQGSAQNAISSAKDTLKNCYSAVKAAESTGANVESLMVTLNEAAASLSNSELAYASNDYDSAYTYATQSQSKLDGFVSQANALKDSAQVVAGQNFFFTVLSVVASAVLLGIGIGAWIVLSRKERRAP